MKHNTYEDFANFSFSAQLWKFNKKKQTLENKNGQWKFENKTWSRNVFRGKLNLLLRYMIYSYFNQKYLSIFFYKLGNEGYIKDKESLEVLGLLDGETIEDTEVILEAKKEVSNNTQKWVKDVTEIDSKDLADGWFKLKNVLSGRFLTAASPTVLTVSGKNSFLANN